MTIHALITTATMAAVQDMPDADLLLLLAAATLVRESAACRGDVGPVADAAVRVQLIADAAAYGRGIVMGDRATAVVDAATAAAHSLLDAVENGV